MSVVPGSITQARWRESGSSDSYVTVPAGLLGIPQFTNNDDKLGNALYREVAANRRKNIILPVYDWSTFAALNTLQIARGKLELEFTLSNGDIYTYDPVWFTARPTIGQVPSIGEVFVADAGVTTNPTSTPLDWTSLGSVREGSNLEINAVAGSQGYGLPFFKHMGMRHVLELFRDATAEPATSMAGYENALCTISLLHPDGNYTRYNNVFAQTRQLEDFSEEGFVLTELTLDAINQNVLTMITMQTTPPDYINGFEISGAVFGYADSDFFAVT